MPKTQTFLLFVITGLLAVMAFTPKATAPTSSFGDTINNTYNNVLVGTTETVNTTSTQILATNTGRLTAQVVNDGTSTVYCLMNGNTTAASSSVNTTSSFNIVLLPIGSSTLNSIQFGPSSPIGPYGGDLNCIAGAADLVAVTDK